MPADGLEAQDVVPGHFRRGDRFFLGKAHTLALSDVLAIPLARKNWMAFCCIGPENFRGAMIIDAPSMFPLFGKAD
jgi:hypothetical protein